MPKLGQFPLSSKETFVFLAVRTLPKGEGVTKPQYDKNLEKNVITISLLARGGRFTVEQNAAHEVDHANQYLRGELGWYQRPEGDWWPLGYEITDEVGAYMAGLGVSSELQTNGALGGGQGDMSALKRAADAGQLRNAVKKLDPSFDKLGEEPVSADEAGATMLRQFYPVFAHP